MKDDDSPFDTVPGWQGYIIVLFLAPFFWMLYRSGEERATAALVAATSVLVAVRVSWPLRKRVWFWLLVTMIVSVEATVVLIVPWTDSYIPGALLIPFVFADVTAILIIIYGANWVMSKFNKSA